MKFSKSILILSFALTICFIPANNIFAGAGSVFTITDTDTNNNPFTQFGSLLYFFDLRDRETFIQLTYQDLFETGVNATAHLQIFDVSNNCSENNFFDTYTINDTHVYNMRDIQTNDGNPSGVVLPDGAYDIVAVVIFSTDASGVPVAKAGVIGNLRILDNNGYEYRTNAHTTFSLNEADEDDIYSFNFNSEDGIRLSDVVGITLNLITNDPDFVISWDASNPIEAYNPFDVDIIDNNEVPFSCRDVIFACVNEDNPRLEELLEVAGTANVASFEYGINNAIPHSKDGELLCPGNTIPEGIVILSPEIIPDMGSPILPFFFGYVGLNNGNGRGSMDSFWYTNQVPFQL